VILLAALLAASAPAPAGDTVRYDVQFPNAVHHEARITVTFPGLKPGPVEVWMSRSSPGRYAIHEFAKNVYAVEAVDGRGRPLQVSHADPYKWLVTGHDGTVRFTYTFFGDRAGGTYSGIDLTHAHLNIPATFAWATGLDHRPIAIRFEVPDGSGWKAATQLLPTKDPLRFTAPDLQYFMDSPTELSDYALRTWTVPAPNGGRYTMRLAVHHLGTDDELDAYTETAKKVVAQEIGVFGEAARYDAGTYTFIADYVPWASGDGMEHRNSTSISSSGSLARNASGLLGTLAHEFFHSWNMERIRSKGIEPFVFTRANPSDGLWFGEGFTSYYDDLSIRRAGLMSDEEYARSIGGTINAVINSPARKFRSPVDMSIMAPFVDAATSIDPTSFANTFLSYYTWGAGVGIGLDFTIRTRFPGKSLDGFMRTMWEQFGRPERPFVIKRPYTVDDLQRTLGAYTGDPAFAADFFTRYIRGRDVVDYASLLAHAGFLLAPTNPDGAFLGLVRLDYGTEGATVLGPTLIGSPLYEAGVDRTDLIESIGGHPLKSDDDWQAIKDAHHPGDRVEIVFVQRGTRRTATLTVAADPRLTVTPSEAAGRELTDAQRAFRADWLGSKAGR
jgi:predicted metalloprotease with PDZ domain